MLRDFPLVAPLGAPTLAGVAVTAGPIRQAATVMLVRPGDDGVQVFTFRRVRHLVFAAGMLVFPGGAVDPRDADPATPWAGPPPAAFATALSADQESSRAVIVAAVRETFEECGVLLAGPEGGGVLTEPLVDDPGWEARRLALIDGRLTLAALLRDAGLVLRADLLRPWAHWLTPPGEPRRFNTRFLVAALPLGQQARDLGGEGEGASWLSAGAAVAAHRAGELPMLPPTLVAMEELAAATSVEQLLGTRRVPRPVMPWLARVADVEPDGPDNAGSGASYVLRIDLDGLGGGEPGPPIGSMGAVQSLGAASLAEPQGGAE